MEHITELNPDELLKNDTSDYDNLTNFIKFYLPKFLNDELVKVSNFLDVPVSSLIICLIYKYTEQINEVIDNLDPKEMN